MPKLVTTRGQVALIAASSALLGGLVAGGAFSIAGGGSAEQNSLTVCVAPDGTVLSPDHGGYCDTDPLYPTFELKTALTAAQADELKQQLKSEAHLGDKLEDKVDSLGELSLNSQQRMQAAMEKFTKMMAMASTVLKKSNETAASIIQNLK
jgi:hypothetical protein